MGWYNEYIYTYIYIYIYIYTLWVFIISIQDNWCNRKKKIVTYPKEKKNSKGLKQITLSKSKKVFLHNPVQREKNHDIAGIFQSSQNRKKQTAKHD